MEKITLTNDFHHTEVNLIPQDGRLSASQVKRAKRILCGIDNCTCSNDIGVRGYGGDNYYITIDFDSTGMDAKPFAHVNK